MPDAKVMVRWSRCGKSSVLRRLATELAVTCGAHVVQLSCKLLAGEKQEDSHKAVEAAMVDCLRYCPSVLVLDDLDVLYPKQHTAEVSQLPH